jgi:drug/metabolite transporter (DMT)-like permease
MKDNKKGIILVIVSMTIFSVQDVMIKFLSVDISMFQILFYRSVIGVALICVYLKLTRQPIKFARAYPILGTCRW